MKKPDSSEELLQFILLIIGLAFIALGCLGQIGLLTPSARSLIQSPALMGGLFLGIGLLMTLIGGLLAWIARQNRKRRAELFASGTLVQGVVESVYWQHTIQVGLQSPYRIVYTYTLDGQLYRGKSGLLWEQPTCQAGDPIPVYVNEAGQSAISL